MALRTTCGGDGQPCGRPNNVLGMNNADQTIENEEKKGVLFLQKRTKQLFSVSDGPTNRIAQRLASLVNAAPRLDHGLVTSYGAAGTAMRNFADPHARAPTKAARET